MQRLPLARLVAAALSLTFSIDAFARRAGPDRPLEKGATPATPSKVFIRRLSKITQTKGDAVYLRPFNFRSKDQARREHAVQYISLPEFDLSKLRTEHPGQYEKPIDSDLDPDNWFHARIVLHYPEVVVYVNNARQPCLKINQLNDRRDGWVGFWVGNGSDGSFSNLRITASTRP